LSALQVFLPLSHKKFDDKYTFNCSIHYFQYQLCRK
jgi:hypothetical protein